MKLEWEVVDVENVATGGNDWIQVETARAVFIRGWIVRTRVSRCRRSGSAELTAETKCFVPDENAQW
jgi:hypothetical protein